MLKMRKNTLAALLIVMFFIGTAFGYAWHFHSNRWASTALYYYFYGQEIGCPTFQDKEKVY